MIGSCHCKSLGPIQGHQKHLLKKLWAHSGWSAAATANPLGPFKNIRSTCQRNNGPIQNDQQLPLQISWANLRVAASAEWIMGPSEMIGSYIVMLSNRPNWNSRHFLTVFNSGPIHNIHSFLPNGPTWGFPRSLVKLHVGSNNYFDKVCVMGLSTPGAYGGRKGFWQ